MELDKNAKENIWLEAIRNMTERDIAYKENIYKKIDGIKKRQILTIIISLMLIIMLFGILYIVIQNLISVTEVISVLTEAFKKLNQ